MASVAVTGLSKRYGDFVAVDDISFEVQPGEVFALLGPNGAGKTTTVEILEGFRKRDAGEVAVLGFDPANMATSLQLRERMGIVLQELAVEPLLTVREVLRRNAGYFCNPRSVDELIELVGLTEKAGARVKNLSGGQQRRLDLALGIVGNPELIFLDEPTTGFDPSARRGAWDLVESLAGEGTTVILTTHYMDEAEALADRVSVIDEGRIVASGTPQSLGGRDLGDAKIRFRIAPGHDDAELHFDNMSRVGELVEIVTDHEVETLHQLTGWSIDNGIALIGLVVERLTLEDIYLQLTGYSNEGLAERPSPSALTKEVP